MGSFAMGCAHKAKDLVADRRPLVHKVYFLGIKNIKEAELRDKILIENQSWNPLNRSKNYLDHPFAMDLDTERIEAFYRDYGYFHAKVTSATTRPYQGEKVIDVIFTIEEGEPTKISQINLIGMELLPDLERQKLASLMQVKTGQILNRGEYLRQKEHWLEWLRQRAYAFAEVTLQVRVNRDLNIGEIDFEAKPGSKVVFGEITVKGCEQTDPQAVAVHTAILRGAFYHPDDVDLAKSRLYDLGLFSSVKIQVVPNGVNPHTADVNVEVVEGKMREAQVGLGLGIESQLTEVHVKGAYTQQNFLGGLRTLRITGLVGYGAAPTFWDSAIAHQGPIAGVEAQFTQPDWLGRNSEFKLNLGYNVGVEYAYQYHGPGVGLGIEHWLWRRRIQLSLSYHFQFLQFFNTATTILQTDPNQAGLLFGYEDPYRLGYFRQSIVLDLRNRGVDATQGLYIGFSAEEGGIYSASAFTYEKIVPEVRGYLPLGSRVTVAARIMFGQIFSQGDTGSPITQRFYLGGPNSHRGFSYNRLSPQFVSVDPKAPDTPALRVPLGGDQMLLLQAEVRVNVVRIFGNWLSFVGFVDGGDVATPKCPISSASCSIFSKITYDDKIDLGNLHWAIGAGLRYKTLIGTLRFDFGVRLNRVDEGGSSPDPGARFAYHISIGEAF